MKFTKETANKILMNMIDAKSLALQYPEYREMVMKDLSQITSESKYNEIGFVIDKYKNKARLAMVKIHKSNLNEAVLKSFLPYIIKDRNTFEKSVFKTESVKLYIVIGTKNPALTGDHDVYQSQEEFDMEYSKKLSSLVLPISNDNAVYNFYHCR